MSGETEEATIEDLRRGDRRAFDRVYGLYRARIYGFLLRLTGRREIAEDLFQETFLALARAAPKLREDTDLAAWLFTVARNQHRSYRRWAMLDLSRWVLLGDDEPPVTIAEAVDDDARGMMALLEEALLALPTAQREVLLLVTVEGFDQEQVGTMLGISYAAVRQRLSRARAELSGEMKRRAAAPRAKLATAGGSP